MKESRKYEASKKKREKERGATVKTWKGCASCEKPRSVRYSYSRVDESGFIQIRRETPTRRGKNINDKRENTSRQLEHESKENVEQKIKIMS